MLETRVANLLEASDAKLVTNRTPATLTTKSQRTVEEANKAWAKKDVHTLTLAKC